MVAMLVLPLITSCIHAFQQEPTSSSDAAPPARPAEPIALLVWMPVKDGCEGRLWRPDSEELLVTVPACPGSGMFWFGPDGPEKMAIIVPAERHRTGSDVEFTAGTLRATVHWEESGWLRYGVRGTEVVAPGTGDRDVELNPPAHDMALFFERQNGVWVQLAALPTYYAHVFYANAIDAGWMGAGVDVGGPLRGPGPGGAFNCEVKFEAADFPAPAAWQTNEAFLTLLEVRPQEVPSPPVGFMPVGGGGLLFQIGWGDTSHATDPVFWCSDQNCAARVRLTSPPVGASNVFAIERRGDHVLLSVEYKGSDASVYRDGPTPVAVFPGAACARWLPVPEKP